MFTRKSFRIVGAVGIAAVFSLTACGDRATANRDYYVTAAHSSHTEVLAQPYGYPVPYVHDVLTGRLVDAKQRPIANSSYYEDCVWALVSRTMPNRPTTCTVIVKTGPKTYVARGGASQMSGGAGYYYGMLGSLGPGGGFGPGSSVTWILPSGSSTSSYKLKVSIRIWGSPPVNVP